jgi:hypothetical protein
MCGTRKSAGHCPETHCEKCGMRDRTGDLRARLGTRLVGNGVSMNVKTSLGNVPSLS